MTDKVQCRGYGERSNCDVELREHLLEGGLCPKCRELRRIDAEREHKMTRDPTREPW